MQPLINAYLQDLDNSPFWTLTSFNALVDALRTLFWDPNLERNSMVALSNIYQTMSVAKYCAWFIGHSEHMKMDGNTQTPHFYKGLKDMIKDLLAGPEK